MKKCKYCKTEIDDKAKICPNCKKKQGPKIGLIIFLIIIGIFIIGLASGGDSEDTKKEKFTHNVTKQYLDSAGLGYYIEGTVKNNTDKDYSYVQIEFICYDKNGNNLGTAIDNTNNLLGNENWKFKAMGMFFDEKVDHCDFKEVTGW